MRQQNISLRKGGISQKPLKIKGVYENGAIIGTVLCHIVSFFIVYYSLRDSICLDFSLYKIMIKPLICCFIMIFISYNSYEFMKYLNMNEYISTIIGIIIAIIIYIIFVFLLRILSKEEVKMLPGGEKIYIFLKKYKIY